MTSMLSLPRFVFHGLVTVMYLCAIVRFSYLPPMPHIRSHEHFAGQFKYLTYWNLLVQFAFFAFSCFVDLMKSPSPNFYKITRIRDKLYAGIVLPYGVFVVFMFWGIYAFDRELIFPRILDSIFPVWLNHAVHTLVFPILLMETYVLKHRHPRRVEGLQLSAAFGLTYLVWTLYLALEMNIWVYPILRVLNWTERFIFLGLSMLVTFVMYFIGEKINTYFWGASVVFKTK